jgi:hypothetical protein
VTAGGGTGTVVGDVRTDALVGANESGDGDGNGNGQNERNNEAGAEVPVLRRGNPSVLHYSGCQRKICLWWNDNPDHRLDVYCSLLHTQLSLVDSG